MLLFTFFFSGELCSLLFSPPSSSPVRGSVPLAGSFTPASWLDVLQPVKSTPAAHHSYTKSMCDDSSCMVPTVQIYSKSHNSACVLPSCWDPSPPEGGSIQARGRFSCGCPLSHWPVRRQGGGDSHKAANDTASHVEKARGRSCIMAWLKWRRNTDREPVNS